MIPSVLVIASRGDVGAVALATLLRRRGATRVTLLDAGTFSRSPITLHPESGPPGAGASADPQADLIYCRAATFDAPVFTRPADSEYALAEMHAVGLSWLWTRREVVVNRPTPEALCGATPDLLRTARACAEVGLRTPEILLATDAARVPRGRTPHPAHRWPGPGVPQDPDALPPMGAAPPLAAPGAWVEPLGPARRRVLVAGDHTDAPPDLAERIVALARTLGLDVAEVRLAPAREPADEPRVLSVTSVPSLAGGAQVRMLAGHLERRATAHAARQDAVGEGATR